MCVIVIPTELIKMTTVVIIMKAIRMKDILMKDIHAITIRMKDITIITGTSVIARLPNQFLPDLLF